MAEEARDPGDAGPAEGAAPERPTWLPEKFKTAEELARSYQELEGRATSLSQQQKGLREQAQAYGLDVTEDGRLSPMYAADAPPDQPTTPAGEEPPFEDQWRQMQERVTRSEQTSTLLARGLAEGHKANFIPRLPEQLRGQAAAMWDQAVRSASPELLANPGTIQAMQHLIYGRLMLEGGQAAVRGVPGAGATPPPAEIPRTEAPGGEPRRGASRPASGVAAEVQQGLSRALEGMGPEYKLKDGEWDDLAEQIARDKGREAANE